MELQRPEPVEPRKRTLPIVMALVLLTLAVGGLVLGLAAVIPQLAAGIAVVAIGAFLVPLFHYVVWGWWLGDRIRASVEAEERETLLPPS